MIPIQTESAWRGTSDCRNCGMRDMVLFADLNEQDFDRIHAPIDDLIYQTGQALYDASDAALGVLTLRKGMLKLVRVTADGRERVVRREPSSRWSDSIVIAIAGQIASHSLHAMQRSSPFG